MSTSTGSDSTLPSAFMAIGGGETRVCILPVTRFALDQNNFESACFSSICLKVCSSISAFRLEVALKRACLEVLYRSTACALSSLVLVPFDMTRFRFVSHNLRWSLSILIAPSSNGDDLGPTIFEPSSFMLAWSNAAWKLHSTMSAIRRASIPTASIALKCDFVRPIQSSIVFWNVPTNDVVSSSVTGRDSVRHTSLNPDLFTFSGSIPESVSVMNLWSEPSIWPSFMVFTLPTNSLDTQI